MSKDNPRARLSRYPLGYMRDAGITILEYAKDRPEKRGAFRFRYRVRYECCGCGGEIWHETIMRRLRDQITECRACVRRDKPHNYRKSDSSPEYADLVPPGWPVPPSVMKQETKPWQR